MTEPADPTDLERSPAYQTPPTEKKVTASTGAAGGAVALIVAVLALAENDQLIEGLPDWIPLLVSVVIAAGSAFLAGRNAPHTARPDLAANKR